MDWEQELSQSAKSTMILSTTSVMSFIIVSINLSVGCCCIQLLMFVVDIRIVVLRHISLFLAVTAMHSESSMLLLHRFK